MQEIAISPLALTAIALFALSLGFAAGGALVWLFMRAKIGAQRQMMDSFKALAADTLHRNSETFLQMADSRLMQREQTSHAVLSQKETAIAEMVKPVRETLKKVDEQLHALEVKREGAYRELAELMASSNRVQDQLRKDTGQLLQALRSSSSRGRWGEIQLRRILEMTGMSAHSQDFSMQESVAGESGVLRPDATVSLPGGRCVVIDSKVPLTAYLDAIGDGSGEAAMQEAARLHAKQVREHVKRLSAKAYWEQVEGSPEFVVMFLPGEHFLSAALDGDSSLLEFSMERQIILATPTTLIAMLRAVAHGWKQEALRENVRQIAEMGRKLYAAVSSFAGHMDTLGGKLSGAVESYNRAVGVMERDVLGRSRKLQEYGATTKDGEIETPSVVEKTVRALTSAQPAVESAPDAQEPENEAAA